MSKEFDAVEVVRKIRDDIYEQTKDMSSAELIEFFRQHGSAAKEQLDEQREVAKRGGK
ncbi:MAG TPA: hypothetical protein VF789_24580 [Thermoanaerobaculia bacterium]